MHEVIFFDVGGTLVESVGLPMNVAYAGTLDPQVDPETLGRAFEQVLGREPPAMDGESVDQHMARWSDAYRRVLAVAGYSGDPEAAIDAMWSLWLEPGALYPEVTHVLAALQARGYRLGVISNWAPCLDEALTRLGLRECFEVAVCSSLIGLRKPDPRIFIAAAAALGVNPESCAYVGDSIPVDVEGARGASMTPILVLRQRDGDYTHSTEREQTSWLTIESLTELLG